MMARLRERGRTGRLRTSEAVIAVLVLLVVGPLARPVAATPQLREYPIPTFNSWAYAITPGPDGNMWFTEVNGNHIARITPTGTITEFLIPTLTSYPYGITAGPDGNIWLVEQNGSRVGRVNLV